MPPVIVTAEFRIVTPMFIGGADQSPSDGIRPPSIKGALRFWWRALNWGRFRQPAGTTDESALKALHAKEARLFGLAAKTVDKEQIGGQGLFLMEIAKQPSINTTSIIADWPTNNTGAGYMAYGILASNGGNSGIPQPHRQGIKEFQDFTVRLCFRPGITQDDKDSILAALNAWSLFGGLGSRSRRGMGSVTRLLDAQEKLLTRTEYEQQVKDVLAVIPSIPLSPYTAISKESRFRVLAEGNDARSVMNQAGQKYREFRGQSSSLRGNVKIPFGLPLQNADEQNRRSSPLLFHVHALANNRFVASVLYLPSSQFHPNYPSISMNVVASFVQGGCK